MGEDDRGDTVRVERVDLETLAERAPLAGSKYLHGAPALDDLTPLPPPRTQASIIADESRPRADTTGPLPLPPAPEVPGAVRAIEGPGLTTRRLQLPGPPSVRELLDPHDARLTLAAWTGGALVAAASLLATLVVVVDGFRDGELPLGALALALAMLGIYPALRLGEALVGAAIRGACIEVSAAQLHGAWERYLDVATRLGLVRPPPLYVASERTLARLPVGLARRRATVISRAALATPAALDVALARALGDHLAGHDEPLDAALLLPLRVLLAPLALLRPLGLAVSPLGALAAARVYSSDRAAAVGVGGLDDVLGEILGGARIDAAALDAQLARAGAGGLAFAVLLVGAPPAAERLARLQRFAAPHLVAA